MKFILFLFLVLISFTSISNAKTLLPSKVYYISFPVIVDTPISALSSSLVTNINWIFSWQRPSPKTPGRWSSYPSKSGFSTIELIKPNLGYIIQTKSSVTLNQSLNTTTYESFLSSLHNDQSIPIKEGVHLLGVGSANAIVSPQEYLNNDSNITVAWQYDNESRIWQYWSPSSFIKQSLTDSNFNEITSLEPGTSFFISYDITNIPDIPFVQGPQGPQGLQGLQGTIGVTGPQGLQGESGIGIINDTINSIAIGDITPAVGSFTQLTVNQRAQFNKPIRLAIENIVACDTNKTGEIRWNGSLFQGCDGTDWINFGQSNSSPVSTIGESAINPATSCKHIIDSSASKGSGYYWVKPIGILNAFKVNCDMITDGGGWTIIDDLYIYRYVTLASIIGSSEMEKSISPFFFKVNNGSIAELDLKISFTEYKMTAFGKAGSCTSDTLGFSNSAFLINEIIQPDRTDVSPNDIINGIRVASFTGGHALTSNGNDLAALAWGTDKKIHDLKSGGQFGSRFSNCGTSEGPPPSYRFDTINYDKYIQITPLTSKFRVRYTDQEIQSSYIYLTNLQFNIR